MLSNKHKACFHLSNQQYEIIFGLNKFISIVFYHMGLGVIFLSVPLCKIFLPTTLYSGNTWVTASLAPETKFRPFLYKNSPILPTSLNTNQSSGFVRHKSCHVKIFTTHLIFREYMGHNIPCSRNKI